MRLGPPARVGPRSNVGVGPLLPFLCDLHLGQLRFRRSFADRDLDLLKIISEFCDHGVWERAPQGAELFSQLLGEGDLRGSMAPPPD